ncbi:hypothetical protein F5X96DRAFT_617306 [Biscogniauxia mediterranea]|nr:hypothetical protein F5X96DRAFT_617306 [Biscogniauxia mediterranea]
MVVAMVMVMVVIAAVVFNSSLKLGAYIGFFFLPPSPPLPLLPPSPLPYFPFPLTTLYYSFFFFLMLPSPVFFNLVCIHLLPWLPYVGQPWNLTGRHRTWACPPPPNV